MWLAGVLRCSASGENDDDDEEKATLSPRSTSSPSRGSSSPRAMTPWRQTQQQRGTSRRRPRPLVPWSLPCFALARLRVFLPGTRRRWQCTRGGERQPTARGGRSLRSRRAQGGTRYPRRHQLPAGDPHSRGAQERALYNIGQANGLTIWSPNVNIFRDRGGTVARRPSTRTPPRRSRWGCGALGRARRRRRLCRRERERKERCRKRKAPASSRTKPLPKSPNSQFTSIFKNGEDVISGFATEDTIQAEAKYEGRQLDLFQWQLGGWPSAQADS